MTQATLQPTAQFNSYADRYLIGEKTSTDQHAKTYQAYDRQARERVAFHVLHPHLYKNVAHRQAIYTRLRARAAIEHSNLVPIMHVGIAVDRLVWITPPFDDGQSLDRLRFGALSDEQIMAIMGQTGRAISHLHAHNFTHGRITPRHLIRQPNGTIQLTNCALLNQYVTLTTEDALYISPEQARERLPITSPAADIYATGIFLYRMINGKLPVEVDRSQLETIIQSHLSSHLPPLTRLSHWQMPLSEMTRRDPTARLFDLPTPHNTPTPTPTFIARARETWFDIRANLPSFPLPNRPNRPLWARLRRGIHTLTTTITQHKWWTAATLITTLFIIGFITLQYGSLIGARGASTLRFFVGNGAVATLEEMLFTVEDRIAQTTHRIGLNEPQSPWEVVVPESTLTAVPIPLTPTTEQQIVAEPTAVIIENNTFTPARWETLTALPPMGTLDAEGVWQNYITNLRGDVVAKRTFLQPDPDRPTTIVAIVAFDMANTRLHYALGDEEPAAIGTGEIPPYHKVAGSLLATFNGGFMATHGQFGAMANGQIALTPADELATVAIDGEDNVMIGEWGGTVDPAANWKSYRQNARLVVRDGTITPAVYSNAVSDWGGTINNEIVTWRSALGLNEDRTVLYYMAGTGLNMPTLGNAAVNANINDLMLLDINAYWVHFAAVSAGVDGRLIANPLFADDMATHPDRYLQQSARDFFYITTR